MSRSNDPNHHDIRARLPLAIDVQNITGQPCKEYHWKLRESTKHGRLHTPESAARTSKVLSTLVLRSVERLVVIISQDGLQASPDRLCHEWCVDIPIAYI
jgi:hypothetical protein